MFITASVQSSLNMIFVLVQVRNNSKLHQVTITPRIKDIVISVKNKFLDSDYNIKALID
jgi:hypothetical protein